MSFLESTRGPALGNQDSQMKIFIIWSHATFQFKIVFVLARKLAKFKKMLCAIMLQDGV